MYSTAADMSRYLTALLHGGANEHGRVLTADSVRTLFRPQFQPDHRVAGMALGFEPTPSAAASSSARTPANQYP